MDVAAMGMVSVLEYWEISSTVPHIFPRARARFCPPKGKESPNATWCRYGNATVVLRVVMFDSVTRNLHACATGR